MEWAKYQNCDINL